MQDSTGNIKVDMKSSAQKLTVFKIAKGRLQDYASPLNDGELGTLRECKGELSWLAHQLRIDFT